MLVLALVLGMAWLTEDMLVKSLIALGLLNSVGGSSFPAVLAAPSQTLGIPQSGKTFVGVVDAVFQLPKAVANRGLSYTFICGVASAGAGMIISPDAADFIGGYALTVVVNKDLINTPATDVVGDQVTITENAAGTGWLITSKIGIFAKEP
jgi:hypothetical protein